MAGGTHPTDKTQKTGEKHAAARGRISARGRLSRPAGMLARLAQLARPRHRPAGMLARSGHMEYDRILFFSDAVFAIAITLLVVELPAPIENALDHHVLIQSGQQLRAAASSSIVGFGISFGAIGLFWVGHHGLFRYIKAFDRPLMLLNLLFLGTIAFLPYPTDLLSSVASQAPAVVFYAACAGTAGLLETIMWLYATRARVGLIGDVSRDTRRLVLLQTSRTPVVFGISIVIAQFSPGAATYSWTAIVVVGAVSRHLYGHHDVADPADVAPDPADVAAEPDPQ
jgi:uncharacterized membrane protein